MKIRQTPPAARLVGALSGAAAGPPAVLIQPYLAFAFSGVALRPGQGEGPGSQHVSPLRVEGSSRGRVVDGDAAEALPAQLVARVRELAEGIPVEPKTAGLDLEWGALARSGDRAAGDWEVLLLQARPLLPSAQDPPPYMSRGVWTRNRTHHPRVLSPFYASVIEASRTRLGLAQGAWLGRLYEGAAGPVPVTGQITDELPDGALPEQRARIELQLGRFLRFVRSYLARRRTDRPGASCVGALLAAAPADCVRARDRWFRFCEIFPAWWDPQAPSIADGLEPLRAICQAKPDGVGPEPARGPEKTSPWQVFAQRVDSHEQDDWVFALMLRVLRNAALDWGAAAVAAGRLVTPEDVFFLTVSEISSGRWPAPELVARRKDLHLAQAAFLSPERVVDGLPMWDEPLASSWSGELLAQGAVHGRAEGIAGPLPGPGEPPAGRIAVVHALTPQDIVFLPGVAGLIVERPGTCGHAVLIARELGIPTVTGAGRCVERIRPGARVQLDGTSGRIRWHQDY